MTGRCVALVALASLAAGCQKYSWYGYQYRMKTEFGGGEEPEAANVEARQLLASARTVAFFPPDVCLNITADVDQKRIQELRASCGVLLSTLERAAERAGYEVLSWQNLRGGKRPIEYAREANVDVLFEINQFELGTLDDSQVERSMSFFVRDTDGHDAPLQVSTGLAQTCAGYAKQSERVEGAADIGTIDIKTVSVSDGRARWRYRKTLSESRGKTYPQHMFTAAHRPHPGEVALGTSGILLALGGGGLLLGEQLSEDNPLTPEVDAFDSKGWSTRLIVLGALAIGGAIAVHYTVGSRKPRADDVLCNPTFAANVFTPGQVAVAPTDNTYSAEHTFQEKRVVDASANKKERIRDTMIAQFIEMLKEVHQPTPAPAPAPAPAPPGTP